MLGFGGAADPLSIAASGDWVSFLAFSMGKSSAEKMRALLAIVALGGSTTKRYFTWCIPLELASS